MRAVVIATGSGGTGTGTGLREPLALFPCVDRPVLQYVVEVLVEHGVTEFDFVLHESPEKIENFLGDGKRWGSRFTFHMVRDPERPYRVLRLLDHRGPLLLVHADRLPSVAGATSLATGTSRSLLYCSAAPNHGSMAPPIWNGCAWLQADAVASVPADATRAELQAHLLTSLGPDGIEVVPEAPGMGSLTNFLQAQRSLLTNSYRGVHLSGRQVEPGVWISRNVVLHPTANLTGPLFIGENSRIGAGAVVGPNAVIGHDTVVDRHTVIQDAAVLPGSYCGEGLELDHVIIDRNRLIDVRLGTSVNISESFILGTMKGGGQASWPIAMLSRLLAAAIFLLTWPLLAIVAFVTWPGRGRLGFSHRQVVQLPASAEPEAWRLFPLYSLRRPGEPAKGRGWRHLLLDFWPSLIQVARGRLRFVGVQPRGPNEIMLLPEDWRALYLPSHAGLITEADIVHGASPSLDEVYSSELYYSAMAGLRHDFGLALRFLGQVVHHGQPQ